MNGILIVNKPSGITSFGVIAALRKKLNQKKIGHMGTLDPMATGVLPVLLGDTAKFQVFSSNEEKSYIATMKFGLTTDTLDITGNILSEMNSEITENDLKKVLNKFLGNIHQIPPMFSAIKKNGVKLCDLARKGVEVDRKSREVIINSINLLNFDYESQEATISVDCSKGTYIRTLCSDIGDSLGCGATTLKLQRTFSNGFNIENSFLLDEILNSPVSDVIQKMILPTEKLFDDLDNTYITEPQMMRFKNGGSLLISRVKICGKIEDEKILKIYFGEKFVGIGKIDIMSSSIKVLKFLK